MPRPSKRVFLGVAAALALLVPLGVFWGRSLMPDSYSMMDMGYADQGGGEGALGQGGHGSSGSEHHLAGGPGAAVSVAELTGPRDRRPDAVVSLVARQETITLAGRAATAGYTLNHTSPGPLIRIRFGDLLQVTLINESVRSGVSLHWHGVDVPNGEDGVAGVTQDAVTPGDRHVYRFIADDPGTYWYHSHQVSSVQVRGGLYGVLVVEPARPGTETDLVAPVHTYAAVRTVDGQSGERPVIVRPGQPVRLRVVNTDNAPLAVTVAGSPYRVLAVDGRDVVGPGEIRSKFLSVPAGGRADLGFTVPTSGSAVRAQLGADGTTSLLLGPADAVAPTKVNPGEQVDLLSYGSPAPVRFEPGRPDRRFEYSIGRRLGFLDGVPGRYWSINGRMFPQVPMFVVAEGDVVLMTVRNHSGEVHPMHLHGHHALVLSRNGVPPSGSPWWVDSLDVASGDSYEIGFVADNPGIWMDHCHNLRHASDGLVAHFAYLGVTTPFRIGGPADNEPE